MAHPYMPLQEGLLCESCTACTCESMEEIPGDGPLHKESWTGPYKGFNPVAWLVSAHLCKEEAKRSTARALPNDLQQATGVHVSDQTVRNRLHEGVMRALNPSGTCAHSLALYSLIWNLPENTRFGRSAISALFLSKMRAGSH